MSTKLHRQSTGAKAGKWVRCNAKIQCKLTNLTKEQIENIEKAQDLIAEDILYRRELISLTNRQASIRKLEREILAAQQVSEILKTAPAQPLSDWGNTNLNADSEEVLAKIEELKAEGDIEKMEAYLNERGNNPDFIELTKLRDETKNLLEKTIEEESLLYNYAINDVSETAVNNTGIEFEYSAVMERTNAVRELREEYAVIQDQLNTYKNADAILAYEISKRLDEEAGLPVYDEKTIGDLVETIDYPSGSREWLEERQKGFGGSDIGPIAAKLNRAYFELGGGEPNKHLDDNYRETLNSKVETITDEMVEEQTRMQTDFTNPASRGNAWEGYIRHKFRENNPDIQVGDCKKSWVKKDDPLYRANFDGLLLDKDGNPDGILEIKTSGIPEDWGDPSEGIYGVPHQYQAQTLHYAVAAGLKRGCVAVVIDDHDYREYHFEIDDRMRQHAANNVIAMHAAHEKVQELRTAGSAVYKGFSGDLISKAEKGNNEAFETPAAYRGETVEETKRRFRTLQSQTPDTETAYRQLFTEQNPSSNKASYVSLDIETSDTTPARGHILEVGMSSHDALGNETHKHDQLYGLSPKAEATTGTGWEEVHHISTDMVRGKTKFKDPAEQKTVLETLRGRIVIAHNAAYEKTWMRKHVEGFVEAERKGEIRFLDTMRLARYFSPNAPTNKLEHFTADNGVEYENAHRAYADVGMMRDALTNLRHKLYRES